MFEERDKETKLDFARNILITFAEINTNHLLVIYTLVYFQNGMKLRETICMITFYRKTIVRRQISYIKATYLRDSRISVVRNRRKSVSGGRDIVRYSRLYY